jgi:hypothetical protein
MSDPSVIEGHVGWVSFAPRGGDWGLSVQIEERRGGENSFQIDGAATYVIDGREVYKAYVVVWLAIWFEKMDPPRGLARAKLTGHWGDYPTCERAEFFSPLVES